jgi:hypothetical protein
MFTESYLVCKRDKKQDSFVELTSEPLAHDATISLQAIGGLSD